MRETGTRHAYLKAQNGLNQASFTRASLFVINVDARAEVVMILPLVSLLRVINGIQDMCLKDFDVQHARPKDRAA